MKSFLVTLCFLGASALTTAADREWQAGEWARPAPAATAPARGARGLTVVPPPRYAIETSAVRWELEDTHPPAERRVVAARVGTAVRFAVENDTVYVVGPTGNEYALHLARTVQKTTAAAAPAPVYSAFGGGHSIKAVTEGGKFVTLEDGSVWEVDPRGWYITVEWQPQAGITVRRAREENGFGSELDNLDTDDGVLVKLVSR